MMRFPARILTIAICWLLAAGRSSAQPADPYVVMETTKGTIVMQIYHSIVPRTASNFLNLVNIGFYDGLTFHRVEPQLIQGGDPKGNGTGNYIDPQTYAPRFIPLEISRQLDHNQPGMVAMARSADPNSASCQFYIIKRPMPMLNGKYAVFGKVIKGAHTVLTITRGDRIVSARIVDPAEGNAVTPAQDSYGNGPPPPPRDPGPLPLHGDSGF
jgi:cyclophilin family peptidyl-prolyl cis-trans isomerase